MRVARRRSATTRSSPPTAARSTAANGDQTEDRERASCGASFPLQVLITGGEVALGTLRNEIRGNRAVLGRSVYERRDLGGWLDRLRQGSEGKYRTLPPLPLMNRARCYGPSK